MVSKGHPTLMVALLRVPAATLMSSPVLIPSRCSLFPLACCSACGLAACSNVLPRCAARATRYQRAFAAAGKRPMSSRLNLHCRRSQHRLRCQPCHFLHHPRRRCCRHCRRAFGKHLSMLRAAKCTITMLWTARSSKTSRRAGLQQPHAAAAAAAAANKALTVTKHGMAVKE